MDDHMLASVISVSVSAGLLVSTGLVGGRKLIWDEAARRIGVLLSIPAAFEGEHFLQVT